MTTLYYISILSRATYTAHVVVRTMHELVEIKETTKSNETFPPISHIFLRTHSNTVGDGIINARSQQSQNNK